MSKNANLVYDLTSDRKALLKRLKGQRIDKRSFTTGYFMAAAVILAKQGDKAMSDILFTRAADAALRKS